MKKLISTLLGILAFSGCTKEVVIVNTHVDRIEALELRSTVRELRTAQIEARLLDLTARVDALEAAVEDLEVDLASFKSEMATELALLAQEDAALAASLQAAVDALDARDSDLQAQIDSLMAAMNANNISVNNKLSSINSKIAAINSALILQALFDVAVTIKLNQLASQLEHLESLTSSQIANLQSQINNLNNYITSFNSRLDNVDQSITTLSQQITALGLSQNDLIARLAALEAAQIEVVDLCPNKNYGKEYGLKRGSDLYAVGFNRDGKGGGLIKLTVGGTYYTTTNLTSSCTFKVKDGGETEFISINDRTTDFMGDGGSGGGLPTTNTLEGSCKFEKTATYTNEAHFKFTLNNSAVKNDYAISFESEATEVKTSNNGNMVKNGNSFSHIVINGQESFDLYVKNAQTISNARVSRVSDSSKFMTCTVEY